MKNSSFKNRPIRILLVTLIATAVALTLTACQKADLVVEGGMKSFNELTKSQSLVIAKDTEGFHTFSAPSGDFFALATAPDATQEDIYASLDVAPFIAAGLKADMLPEGYKLEDNRLIIYSNFTDEAFSEENPSSLEVMKDLVKSQRKRFGYHEALDHFGIELGNGNMVEWAADMTTNDKDLVFVVEPSVLALAGLNPDAVEGWLHADVVVMDAQGNKSTVKKLLKPFELP